MPIDSALRSWNPSAPERLVMSESLRLAVFASDEVGCNVASLLAAKVPSSITLIVDAGNRGGWNDRMRAECPELAADILEWDADRAEAIVSRLGQQSIDLGILAWWPHIVKRGLLETARLGFLNFHPSLLPHARGKDPNFWSLVERRPFGATIHWVDEGVDTGPIAFQTEIPVGWEDNGQSLNERSRTAIVELFERNLPRILAGDIPRMTQPEAGSAHRRRELDPASRIDLDAEYRAEDLLNRLRARTFPPHPACWFESGGERYEVRVEIRRMRGERT
jgi:methionyl-tRNA formyltransferase